MGKWGRKREGETDRQKEKMETERWQLMMIKMEIKQFQLSACAFGLSVISPPVGTSQSSQEKRCYRAVWVPAFDLIF